MACDLCGKKGVQLEDLLSIYKTDDVQQICGSCASLATKQVSKAQRVAGLIQRGWVKRWLTNKREEFRLTEDTASKAADSAAEK